MKNLKIFLKNILFSSIYGIKFWQFIKAVTLLRQKNFRELFFAIKKDDICLDLGANYGYASLIMWLKGAKFIYALEPNKMALNLLRINLKGIKNIQIIDKAISSNNKKQNLYLHKDIKNLNQNKKILELSQASSLISSKKNIGKCFYEIEAITLDDLYMNLLFKPSIIKCDIEGGEYLIYEQLVRLAKSNIVRKIFVECHNKKYPQFKNLHSQFIKLIDENNLNKIINTKWH